MPYTNTNIFTNYHDKLVDLIVNDDTKIVTAFFNLKPVDVISLKLSSTIYFNGFNYIINSVKDYNAQGTALTKVELVKLSEAIKVPALQGLISIDSISPTTATPSNVIAINGNSFETASIPESGTFAYFQLASNTSDLFQNFLSGEIVNSGSTPFQSVDSRRALITDSATNRYFKTNDDPNAGYTNVGFLGTDGRKTTTMALRTYFDSDLGQHPTGSGRQTLWFAGNVTSSLSYVEVFVDNNGKVNWERYDSGSSNIETVTSDKALNADEWYSVTFRYKHDDTNSRELWVDDELVGIMSGSTFDLDVPVDPALDAMYLGHNPNTGVTTDGVFRTLRLTNEYVRGEEFERLTNKDIIEIYLRNVGNQLTTQIEPKWLLPLSNTQFYFTIPQMSETDFFDIGDYKLYVKYRDFQSEEIDFSVIPVPIQTSSLDIRFDSFSKFSNDFDYLEKQWGGDNGGVVADNVVFEEVSGSLELVTYANGDNYTGSITGVDSLGNSTTRKDRVGGVIVSKKYWGFGEYTVEAKTPSLLGVAPAFWTFHYEEIYDGDPRYQTFLSESLHEQGDATQGFYITRNHEIDIEFPSHLPQQDIQADAELYSGKLNSWRGELKSAFAENAWQNSGSNFYEEYRDWLVPIKETHKNQMTATEKQFSGGRWSNFGGSSITITQNQDLFRVTSGSATRIQSTGGTSIRKYDFIATKAGGDYDYFVGMWVYNQGPTTVNVISAASGFPNTDIPTGSLVYVAHECIQNNDFCTMEIRTENVGDNMDIIAFEPTFKEGSQRGTTQKTPVNRLTATEIQFEGRWSGSTTPTTDSILVSGSTETGYRINSGSKYELTFTSSKAPDTFLYDEMPYRFGAWIKNNSGNDLTVTMSGSVGEVDSYIVSGSATEYARTKGVCVYSSGQITVTIEASSGTLDFTGYNPILAEYTIDGYREYGWDWNEEKIDFFVDGQLQDTVKNNISSSVYNIVDENNTGYYNSYVVPDIPGKMNAGLWFPSAGGGKNWAGDVNGEAPWSRVKMPIRRIKFTPTTNSASLAAQRNIGETYATVGIESPAGADRGSGNVTEG